MGQVDRNKYCLNIMKKSNIIKGVLFFSVLTLISGSIFMAQAASDGSFQKKFNHGQKMSAEQKATFEAQHTERQASREFRQEAVQKALDNNDYQAWVAAVGSNNPMTEKITESNFTRFIEAHQLMKQAVGIMAELGIEKGGFGSNFHMGGQGMPGFPSFGR